ncbi:hypothetical protein O181_027186 [Austropuccinia psidii MF-1]|uniref:Mediator of RNA polymerase II transcription subunit 6 n=1 Tax=Austropuccinia psidii MF-1 TaxID=1389203 RepID=A0A9Q3CLV8_9BASI|nr:hypothetical protein [Austropuccinia psidii MF-1]
MTTTISGISIPSSDLCHVQWRSLAWVLENGPITEANAMDYFALSPFYDRRSTNQVLRMQSMFSGQPTLDHNAQREALKRFVGIEFALVLARPEQDREGGLFVIEKRDRKGYDEFYPIASFYILKTSIYQAPSLHATLSARVLTSLSSLNELLDLARSHKPTYNSRQGYAWRISDKLKSDQELHHAKTNPAQSVDRTDSPAQSTHEPETMDIDALSVTANGPPKPTDSTQSADNSTESFNPILFRALQNTSNNFVAFKLATAIEPVSETATLPTSQAPSPSNPAQIPAVNSTSNQPSPTTTGTMPSQLPAPPRRQSMQDSLASPSAGSPKPGPKSGSVSKKKPKRVGGRLICPPITHRGSTHAFFRIIK